MNSFDYAVTYAYVHGGSAIKKRARDLIHEERGAADFIAVILIIAVVVALVVVFRKKIAAIFSAIWTKINGDADAAINGGDGAGNVTIEKTPDFE